MFQHAIGALGAIDILVNNAGLQRERLKPLPEILDLIARISEPTRTA